MSIREKIVRDFKFAICESKAKRKTFNFQNMNLENSIKVVAMKTNGSSLYNNMAQHQIADFKKNKSPIREKNFNGLISKTSCDKKQTFQHLKLKSFDDSIIHNQYECYVINDYPNRSLKRKKNEFYSKNMFL